MTYVGFKMFRDSNQFETSLQMCQMETRSFCERMTHLLQANSKLDEINELMNYLIRVERTFVYSTFTYSWQQWVLRKIASHFPHR